MATRPGREVSFVEGTEKVERIQYESPKNKTAVDVKKVEVVPKSDIKVAAITPPSTATRTAMSSPKMKNSKVQDNTAMIDVNNYEDGVNIVTSIAKFVATHASKATIIRLKTSMVLFPRPHIFRY